ncbi:MAG: crotonase/enoyl-CoA hydratase family protein, partial [Myxococcota bacterium]
MTDYDSIDVSIENHIAEVSLKGPGKGNALGPEFWEEFPAVFDALDADDDVRAVIVRGAGDQFTFGLDLKRNSDLFSKIMGGQKLAKERSELYDKVREWQDAFDAIERCSKPTIAAVHGHCIGGGVNLIAACDTRICSEGATFSLREVRIAIVPDLGALQRLPRIVGEGATRRMAMTGEDFGADQALTWGLVEEITDDADALFERAREIADDIASNPPLVVQGIKNVLNFSAEHGSEAGRQYVATWNSAFLQS